MKATELDALMAGHELTSMELSGPNDEVQQVVFTRHDLETPIAMRAAWRRQTGWEMPRYGQEDHDQIVRVLFQLADRLSDD